MLGGGGGGGGVGTERELALLFSQHDKILLCGQKE